MATDVDGYDTYVAGAVEAIEAVLASPLIEAVRVTPADPVAGL